MSNIPCPFHDDSTPSLAVYPDGKYYCFGCQKAGPVSDLGLDVPITKEKYVEPIEEKLAYIQDLPIREIRGVSLRCDADSYYILYPSGDYFVSRYFSPASAGQKYRCPSGWVKPLYTLPGPPDRLLIVEGQLNALSCHTSGYPATITSPGGTGDFKDVNHLPFYRKYSNITIIVDNDGPGAIAGLALSKMLIAPERAVNIALFEPDANDVLVNYGKDELKKRIDLAVRGGLSSYQKSLPTS